MTFFSLTEEKKKEKNEFIFVEYLLSANTFVSLVTHPINSQIFIECQLWIGLESGLLRGQ